MNLIVSDAILSHAKRNFLIGSKITVHALMNPHTMKIEISNLDPNRTSKLTTRY